MIPVVSLWEALEEHLPVQPRKDRDISVFDPCASKPGSPARAAVRRLVRRLGYGLVELDVPPGATPCCGYGGGVYSSNPTLVRDVRRENAALGALPYVTYCANCRDSFLLSGKRAFHILDLVCDLRNTPQVPDLSLRRENRLRLKQALSLQYLGVHYMPEEKDYANLKLEIPTGVREKMDRQLILNENLQQAIASALQSGQVLYREQSETYITHLREGFVTFWVEYKPLGESRYLIQNAYYHRLAIAEDTP